MVLFRTIESLRSSSEGPIGPKLTLNERNQATSAATGLAESVTEALGGASGSAANAREASLSLGSSLLGSLSGLVGGGGLEAAASETEDRRTEHRADERGRHLELSGDIDSKGGWTKKNALRGRRSAFGSVGKVNGSSRR